MATQHGSVHAEISHERGMGEETMMAFIHKYLNSILQPFADSVDELNGAVTQLTADVETFAGHEKQLQDHAQTLKVMQAEMKAAKVSMLEVKENQQKQFADVDSQLCAGKKEAKKVKEDLFELDRRHRESHSMMLDVKRINAAADLEVRKLAVEVNNVGDVVMERVTGQLDPLRAEVARVVQGSSRTEESCRKSEERVQKQGERLEAFLENHGLQRRQEELRVKAILKSISDLDHKLGQTNANLKQQVLRAKDTDEELATLARRHDQTMRMQVVQERQQQESNDRQAVFTERLDGLRADIQNVMESLGLTEGAANLVLTVEKLKEASSAHGKSLDELHALCRDYGSDIVTLQERADLLLKADAVLEEEDKRIEETLAKRLQELHEDFCRNEERDQDQLKQEADTRARQHEECMKRIRSQEEESAKLSDSLKPLEAGLAARQHYRQHAQDAKPTFMPAHIDTSPLNNGRQDGYGTGGWFERNHGSDTGVLEGPDKRNPGKTAIKDPSLRKWREPAALKAALDFISSCTACEAFSCDQGKWFWACTSSSDEDCLELCRKSMLSVSSEKSWAWHEHLPSALSRLLHRMRTVPSSFGEELPSSLQIKISIIPGDASLTALILLSLTCWLH
ncbi:unnamed protein product [Symbiodinium sp. KB8]|nr:unnamed protein product [Symbiodinium sp. KB8]